MTIGSKAAALATQALSAAANMLAFYAISQAVQLAVTAIDNYIHRTEKAQEALNQSKSAYRSAANEIEELESQLTECGNKIEELENSKGIGKLVGDEEYNSLTATNEELERKLLLKREEQRLNALDLAQKATTSYNTSVESQYSKNPAITEDGYVLPSSQVLPIQELELALDKYTSLAAEKERIDNELLENAEKRAQIEDINSAEYKNLAKEYQALLSQSEKFGGEMAETTKRAGEMYQITGGLADSYKLLTDSGILLTESQSRELGSVRSVNDEYMAFLRTLNSVSDKQSALGADGSVPLFDIRDEGTSKTIEAFQGRMERLSGAIEKIKNQDLSGSDLIDLQQEFPELIGETERLDEILAGLVDGSLSSVVKKLQEAGAPENLLNAFRQLADEAKGLAGADWAGTFQVFDGVGSQISELESLIEALGSSYTLTSEEARRFADTYPELLSRGQATSDGLIQFNKDVTDSFVAGKEAELQADTEAQIAQLENRKRVLEAQKATAQAALDLIAAQASREIDAENQKSEKKAEISDNLIQHLVDLGVTQQNADAVAKELMGANAEEYDRVVSEVAGNVDSNLTGSINDASGNVHTQSGSMIDSLFSVAKQAANTAKSILSIGSDNLFEAAKEPLNAIRDAVEKFSPKTISSEFKKLT